jgi:hypothetical protein
MWNKMNNKVLVAENASESYKQFNTIKVVPWLRRFFADLSQRRTGFDPGSVHVGFVVEKVALGQVFPPSTSVFLLSLSFYCCSIQGKTKKLIIFITRMHDKLQSCGMSVASAAGPLTTKTKNTIKSPITALGPSD